MSGDRIQSAVALYGRTLDLVARAEPVALDEWWPEVEPVCTVPAVRSFIPVRLVPSPRNPVHGFYPFVAATLGVRVVRSATWAQTVEVSS